MRQKSAKDLKVENLKNDLRPTNYVQVPLRLKQFTSTTTLKTCQTALTSNPSLFNDNMNGTEYYKNELNKSVRHEGRDFLPN